MASLRLYGCYNPHESVWQPSLHPIHRPFLAGTRLLKRVGGKLMSLPIAGLLIFVLALVILIAIVVPIATVFQSRV